jgi:hypothetical protein
MPALRPLVGSFAQQSSQKWVAGGGSTVPVASQPRAKQTERFHLSLYVQMWGQFVDHVVDTAYSRTCTADADMKVGASQVHSSVAFTEECGVKGFQ